MQKKISCFLKTLNSVQDIVFLWIYGNIYLKMQSMLLPTAIVKIIHNLVLMDRDEGEGWLDGRGDGGQWVQLVSELKVLPSSGWISISIALNFINTRFNCVFRPTWLIWKPILKYSWLMSCWPWRDHANRANDVLTVNSGQWQRDILRFSSLIVMHCVNSP